MENLRKYGCPPFGIAVVHGGPGAAGETAPLARQLASGRGVLEPIQTALSLGGQVEELKTVLAEHGEPPCVLIGFSWGAWLSFILAAKHPPYLKKLILIGSGPFEEKYAKGIAEKRWARLTEKEREEAVSLLNILDNPRSRNKNATFGQLGNLFSTADDYDPIPVKHETLDCRFDVFRKVWPQGKSLRKDGKLLELGRQIKVPVIAIHGDYDPHPAEGVQKPLSSVLTDFRFILLKKCGHSPWMERQARDEFFCHPGNGIMLSGKPVLNLPKLNFLPSLVYWKRINQTFIVMKGLLISKGVHHAFQRRI